MKYIIVFCIILFSACGDKKYFSAPEVNDIKYNKFMRGYMKYANINGVTLSDGSIITKGGETLDIKLDSNYFFLNYMENILLISEGNDLVFMDKRGNKLDRFNFESSPVSASFQGNKLAIICANNEIYLLEIDSKKILFSKKYFNVKAIDSKLSNIMFYEDLVIYPMLDGKLLVLNIDTLEIMQNISLGSESSFSNIIYLNVFREQDILYIVSATQKRILISKISKISNNNREDIEFKSNIKDVLATKSSIFILTFEGNLMELDMLLNIIREHKFTYANLNFLTRQDHILYLAESQGLIILVDPSFNTKIYKLDVVKNKVNLYANNKIYFHDGYINLPTW